MSDPNSAPYWPSFTTPNKAIHSGNPDADSHNLTPAQIQALRQELIQIALQALYQAFTGFFPQGSNAQSLLSTWGSNLQTQASNALSQINSLISGVGGTVIGDVVSAIQNGATAFLSGGIPVGWIGNFVQELVPAGNFPNASSVGSGPFAWDGSTAGAVSGFSMKVTANGNTFVEQADPIFRVFPGQTLAFSGYPMWSGLAFGSGTTPIRIAVTPYSDQSTALTRVDLANLTPSGASSSGWAPQMTGTWTVPSGVNYARFTSVVTSDATAGTVAFSNLSAHTTSLLPLNIAQGLTTGQTLQQDFQSTVDQVINGFTAGSTSGNPVSAIAGAFTNFFSATGKFGTLLTNLFGSNTIGTALQNSAIPNITKAMSTDIQAIVDAGVNAASGGSTTGNAISAFKTALQGFLTAASTLDAGKLANVTGTVSLSALPASILTTASTIAASAISGVSAAEQATRDAIANALGIGGTGNSLTVTQNGLTQTNQTAIAAAAAAAAANAQLAAQNAQSNAGATGLNFSVTFQGSSGASLPAQFSGSDIVIGANGYAGIKTSDPNGTYQTSCNQLYTTDNQAVSVVLGNYGGSTNAPLVVLFHSNTGYTQGAYMSITNAGVTIGSYSGALGSRTYTAFTGGSWSGTLGTGSLVEVFNTGTAYSLLIGGNVVLTCTGSGVTTGASYRSATFVMTRASTTGWFTGTTTYDAFSAASFAMSDYVIPTYVGSGALISRTSASQLNSSLTISGTPAVAPSLLPSSYFNVNNASTADITVTLSSGTFKVAVADWYDITLMLNCNGSTNSGSAVLGAVNGMLYHNGSAALVGSSLYVQQGQNSSGTQLYGQVFNTSAWKLYLNANDTVQAGYALVGTQAAAWSTGFIGDTNGYTAWFSIARHGQQP